ncbi:MAG: hypothetical protein JRI25_20615 [Deltaproteobacteria bacterium]|nr:hypothetical protein [Deltaproteobacteria bacterium]
MVRILRTDAVAATGAGVLVLVWVLLLVAVALGRVPGSATEFLSFAGDDPWPLLLTAAGTLGGGLVCGRRVVRIRRVFARGVVVRGQVEATHFHRGRGRITVAYWLDGQRHSSWAPVRGTREVRRLAAGDEVDLVVLPDDPGQAFIRDLYCYDRRD